jgi:hypothetical protein
VIKNLSLRRLPQSEAKKIMRNVVAVVPLLWNLEQNPMMCGGARGGGQVGTLYVRNGATVGTTEYLLACLQDVSVCVCVDVCMFGGDLEFRKSTIN